MAMPGYNVGVTKGKREDMSLLKGLPHNYASRVQKIALVYRNSMVPFFFPGHDINTCTNLKKTASSEISNHSW